MGFTVIKFLIIARVFIFQKNILFFVKKNDILKGTCDRCFGRKKLGCNCVKNTFFLVKFDKKKKKKINFCNICSRTGYIECMICNEGTAFSFLVMKIGVDKPLKIRIEWDEKLKYFLNKLHLGLFSIYNKTKKQGIKLFENENASLKIQENFTEISIIENILKPRNVYELNFTSFDVNLQKDVIPSSFYLSVNFETNRDGFGWSSEYHSCYDEKEKSLIEILWKIYYFTKKNREQIGILPKPVFCIVCFYITLKNY